MEEPGISIVMPVNNASKTLHRAIESILSQTFTNFELLVINNGSTDQTSEIINQYQDSRIILVSQPKKALVPALNQGIKLARAGFIARMDADDRSHPTRLKVQYDYLRSNPGIGIVSCLVNYMGNRIKNRGYYLHVQWMNQLINSNTIYDRRFMESPLGPSVSNDP